MLEQFTVAGIGELLWDIFPNHKRLGGAPANFAHHTQQLGATAFAVSCIGMDELGTEIKAQLEKLGLAGAYVKESSKYPTGKVDVVLKAGKPTYQIHEHVAWDHIPFSPEIKDLAGSLHAACFGSLSQRSSVSKKTIHSFIRQMRDDSLRIFDVNLRPPFYSQETLSESLDLANILKLSDEELPVLADLFGLRGNVEKQLRQLIERYDLRLIAYTRGPHGSLLLGPGESSDFAGCEGPVLDTVGAGDSFTATLCMGLLLGKPLDKVNQFANEVAAYVCTQMGATPELPANLTGKRAFA
ncbi:carbohydrate kinase [Pelagicoccus sp. SDUM812005]|uniref:carbohydrate kinase family protein n=1 Tax=Pelagicoccus sp. SDUM812005 TaxID=3041257 RepID=UPI00280C4031|nr:carbohydrate kinase [Pelagicoccus sp. SDUM812005]MDQ8182942.1 carbohydrate kinase [Pelagicoccus sp. SDUM812005]